MNGNAITIQVQNNLNNIIFTRNNPKFDFVIPDQFNDMVEKHHPISSLLPPLKKVKWCQTWHSDLVLRMQRNRKAQFWSTSKHKGVFVLTRGEWCSQEKVPGKTSSKMNIFFLKYGLVSMRELINTFSRLFYLLIGLIFMVLCIRKLLVSFNKVLVRWG